MSLVTSMVHLAATRYMQVAATTALFWDYFITLENEIKYFWSGRWSWARLLFFGNRYFAMFALTLNTGALLSPLDSDRFCSIWTHYLVTGTGLAEIFTVQGILITRLYGMYNASKMVLYSLLALLICSSISAIVVVHESLKHTRVTAHPVAGLVACSPTNSPGQIWASWVPILAFESVAFFLAARKSFIHLFYNPFRGSFSFQVMQVFLRDSIIYFLVIFLAYLMTALIWRLAPPTLLDIVHGPTLAAVSVCGTRMMINMRERGRMASNHPSGIELVRVHGEQSGEQSSYA